MALMAMGPLIAGNGNEPTGDGCVGGRGVNKPQLS